MNTSDKIAVCSRSFSNNRILRHELCERYKHVFFNSGERLKGVHLIEFLRNCSRAIIALETVDDQVLAALPQLKVISKFGVGLDGIDLKAMERHGVQLGWTSGVNRRSVSELVLSLMVSMLRYIPSANESVKDGSWTPYVGRSLTGRTLGIIGCGNIGHDLVELLTPFQCSILVADIKPDHKFYKDHCIKHVDLEELLIRSEVITLHTPLNRSTQNILSAERLEFIKKDAVIINTARGGLVDEKALKPLLKMNKQMCAAFDVFDREPPDDKELLDLPNFFATPHLGGSTREGILAMGRAAIRGLESCVFVRPEDY